MVRKGPDSRAFAGFGIREIQLSCPTVGVLWYASHTLCRACILHPKSTENAFCERANNHMVEMGVLLLHRRSICVQAVQRFGTEEKGGEREAETLGY